MKRAACRIVEKLRRHGYEAFFAGGWVRDFLLGRNPKDIDIATNARPDEVLRLFPKSRAIGAQFGVVQVKTFGHPYEVATFRSDNAYLDGRHPASVSFSGPEQDAQRRDFTINGLFYDPMADKVIDYVHGKTDIQDRIIRTIGSSFERFTEDKLRMLRAIRFACTLDFTIDQETWRAVCELSPDILQVSWERIRDELIKIFAGPDPGRGLDLLRQSGLLASVLPELDRTTDLFTHTKQSLSLLSSPGTTLVLGTLLHELGSEITEEVCRRLRLSNDDIEAVVDLVATQPSFAQARELRESALIRLLRKCHIQDQLELFRVHSISGGNGLELYRYCLAKMKEYGQRPVAPVLISGDDLIALGYVPGPAFRQILQTVEDLQLEKVLKTHEEALEYVKQAFPKEV